MGGAVSLFTGGDETPSKSKWLAPEPIDEKREAERKRRNEEASLSRHREKYGKESKRILNDMKRGDPMFKKSDGTPVLSYAGTHDPRYSHHFKTQTGHGNHAINRILREEARARTKTAGGNKDITRTRYFNTTGMSPVMDERYRNSIPR